VTSLLIILHVIICLVLIIAVLLQSGKSADLAGAFGGGGSQTVFGPRGAGNILSKVTTISAVMFMVTSMGLWILSARGDRSVVRGEELPAENQQAVTETSPQSKEKTPVKKEAVDPDQKKQPEEKAATTTVPEKK
jgi:preprotein translocase subunit SecG